MRNLERLLTGLLLLATLPLIAQAETGRELHEENCISCHAEMEGGDGSGIYTREDRFIDDRDSLETQVQRCATNQDLQWFEDEVEAVADHLDEEYYDF
ncbi:MAG: c-type cytochrome [Thiohalospira sp.]